MKTSYHIKNTAGTCTEYSYIHYKKPDLINRKDYITPTKFLKVLYEESNNNVLTPKHISII